MSSIVIAEMREISQMVFRIFKEMYIDEGKNIFDIIDALSLRDVTGRYAAFVESKIQLGDVQDVDGTVARIKARLKSFIVYQLGNQDLNHGIGCGYYDSEGTGTSAHQIRSDFNDYLFGECFNPTNGDQNYQHFLDYLLINFASMFASEGRKFRPTIEEFTKVLQREKLTEYWRTHNVAIKNLRLTSLAKKVFTPNYTVSYEEDLQEVYNLLDSLLSTTPAIGGIEEG